MSELQIYGAADLVDPFTAHPETVRVKASKVTTAIKKAGLDYTLEKVKAFAGRKGQFREIPGQFAIVREGGRFDAKDWEPMGPVGRQYHVIQNQEAFAPFDHLGLDIVGVGIVNKGRRIWIQALCPGAERFFVGGGRKDEQTGYIIITTAHDGSGALEMFPCTVRAICENTFAMARNQGKDFTLRVQHYSSAVEKIAQAESMLKATITLMKDYKEVAQGLSQVKGDKLFAPYMDLVFPNPLATTDKQRAQAITEAMDSIYEEQKAAKEEAKAKAGELVKVQTNQRRNSIAGVRTFFDEEPGESAWHLFNAVTGYVNHGRGMRVGNPGGRSEQDQRMNTLLFGDSAKLLDRAYTGIRELAKV